MQRIVRTAVARVGPECDVKPLINGWQLTCKTNKIKTKPAPREPALFLSRRYDFIALVPI
jgi:hypothetical protein